MADQELNNFENPNSMEESLRKFEPLPLAVSEGAIMFESGRAVGREEALVESRKSASRSLTFWRVATAASLGVALLSFSGIFNRPTPSSTSSATIAKSQVQPATTEQLKDLLPAPEPATLFPLVKMNKDLPTGEQTLIGIRNRLSNRVFQTDFDRPKHNSGFVSTKPSTTFQLMQEYSDKGAF
jgi:hypothetical protein